MRLSKSKNRIWSLNNWVVDVKCINYEKNFTRMNIIRNCIFSTCSRSKKRGVLVALGGIIVPVDIYKSIGQTKIGYHEGFFLDKYFLWKWVWFRITQGISIIVSVNWILFI